MGLLSKTTTPPKFKAATLKPLTIAALKKDVDTAGRDEFPVPIYQFSVEIDNELVALFQKVSGMTVKRAVEPLTVGGQNNYTLEFPGQVSYDHVTLEVGLSSSSFFYDWMMHGQYEGYAHAKNFVLIQRRPNPDYSGGDDIIKEVRRWKFHNAFPVSWKISELNIDDSDKIVIETLELSFDFFEPVQTS